MKPLKVSLYLVFSMILSVFCAILPILTPIKASAKLTQFVYARVMLPEVYLYSAPNPIKSNEIFEIPYTYFVLLISDYNNMFYKAQYRDEVGFVLKSCVTPVKETPKNPYLTTHSVFVFSNDGLDIMSTPNKSAYTKTRTELNAPLSYYGKIEGYEKAQNRGTTWYYVNCNNILGYVYAGLCESDSLITLNDEVTTPIENPFLDSDYGYLYNLIDLSSEVKILLVFLILIPAIAILFLMFLPIFPKKFVKTFPKIKRKDTLKALENFSDDQSL